MTNTSRPVFYFDTHARNAGHMRLDPCGICGAPPATNANPLPHHSMAVHDVFYFLNHGINSVTFPNRPFVEGWANGTIPLPE